ncbi:MAG: MoxR family ATPase [Pseudomonadota bacterium]
MSDLGIADLGARLKDEVAKAIVGQDEAVELLLIALFSRGHVLLEGPPGTAKTLLARSFSRSLDLSFSRIQFTPDLMPGDILGTNLFDFQSSTFRLTKGPIFAEMLLADEINRAPPKTQAALLEAMQERQVTIDAETLKLSDHFMVIATQNPIESQGTYPLPEAQLDRFTFKHVLDYPDAEQEADIVRQSGASMTESSALDKQISAVLTPGALTEALGQIANVKLSDDVADYIVRLVRATRDAPSFSIGASPRSGVLLARAVRARAGLHGRDYTIPDDVKALALPTFRHRLILSPAAEVEGQRVDDALSLIIEATDVPR